MLFVYLVIGGLVCRTMSTGTNSDGNSVTYAEVKATVSYVSLRYAAERVRQTDSLPDMKGVYAAFGETTSFSGRLIKAEPYDACLPLTNPSPSLNRRLMARKRQVALLVQHGGCDYTRKMKNARLANVSAVLLKNRNNRLMQMEADVDWPGFVAVMVTSNSGEDLEKSLNESFRLDVNVTIHVEETESEDNRHGLIDEKAFTVICVAFGLVIALSLFGLSFFYVQRCRLLEAERRQQVT